MNPVRRAALVFWLLCLIPTVGSAEPLLPMPPSGSVAWGNWSFEYRVGDANKEGLVIQNVRWKGTTVLHKGSMPVIRVKYRGDGESLTEGCGPYRDRIHWGNISFVTDQLTPVVARIFDNNVFEIAIFAEIGGYDVWQAWYFRKSGRLEPMVYSRGWSCGEDAHEKDHKHHPYWRLDFDVEGVTNEVWRIRTKTNDQVQTFKYPQEWNSWRMGDDAELAWTINKPGSSKHVLIRYPSNEFRDPGGSPWFEFSSKDMGIRRYHHWEDNGWKFDAVDHLGYKVLPESVAGHDIVFWTVGHLAHVWSPIDELIPEWHSSGPIIDAKW